MKNLIRLLRLSFCTAILMPAISFSANSIYKWEDENGNTHYGDIRPDGTNAQQMKIKRFAGQKSTPSPQSQAKQLNEKKAAADKFKESSFQKGLEMKAERARCTTATSNLNTLKNNSRVKIRDKDGYRYLTPEEMGEKMSEAQNIMTESCKKGG